MSENKLPQKTVEDELRSTLAFLDCLKVHHDRIQASWSKMRVLCDHMNFVDNQDFVRKVSDRIRKHDISKFDQDEFFGYRNHRRPTEWLREVGRSVGVSVNDLTMTAFKEAKANHIHKNGHHWENWTVNTSLTFEEKYEFMVEMICDWMARGVEQNNTAQEYYDRTRGITIPEDVREDFYKILKAVS